MKKSSDKDNDDLQRNKDSPNLPNIKSKNDSEIEKKNYTKIANRVNYDYIDRHHRNRRQNFYDKKEKYSRDRDLKEDRKPTNRPKANDISPIHRSSERKQSIKKLTKSPITCKENEEGTEKLMKPYENQGYSEDIWLKEKGRFDQTEFSINDRFSALSIISAPLKIEDNISVEIERNIRGKEPFRIPRRVDYSLVDIVRQPSDDTRYLMMRETFDVFKDLIDLDKRTIKLHEKIDDSNFNLPSDYSNVENRRINISQINEKQSIDDRIERNRERKNSFIDKNVRKSSKERTDRRRLEMHRLQRRDNNRGSARLEGRNRHYLSTDSRVNWRISAEKNYRHETRGHGIRGVKSQDFNPSSRNVELMQNKQIDWRSNNKSSVKDRLGVKLENGEDQPMVKIMRLQPDGEITEYDKEMTNTLPDFSKRPGKYAYDAWKDKPELIPRGASYFEHDTREDDDWQPRGFKRDRYNGRGFQRTRGQFNRPYNYLRRNAESFDAWKHDKFEELQDNRLSSTTEK